MDAMDGTIQSVSEQKKEDLQKEQWFVQTSAIVGL